VTADDRDGDGDRTREATHAHHALRRVVNESEHVSEKIDAYERFRSGVSEVETWSGSVGSGFSSGGGDDAGSRVGGGLLSALTSADGSDGCDRVLELFEGTVRPYSVEDVDDGEPVRATAAEALGEEVAYSLSPETEGAFPEGVNGAVVTSTADRQSELRAMEKALAREEECVRRSLNFVEEAVASDALNGREEPELLGLRFDELRRTYRELSELQEGLERGIDLRQETLHETTNHGAAAGVEHRELVTYLYQDFPSEYPVLSTLTRLNELCGERKRVLRDHISRSG